MTWFPSRWLLLQDCREHNSSAQNERPPLTVNPCRIILLFVRRDIFVVCWSLTTLHVNGVDVPPQSSPARIIWQIDSWVPFGNRNIMWYIFLSLSQHSLFSLSFQQSFLRLSFFSRWVAKAGSWTDDLKKKKVIPLKCFLKSCKSCDIMAVIDDIIIMYRISQWIITHDLSFFLLLAQQVVKVR